MRETAKPRGADEGRVSDGDRPIQQLTTAIPLLTRSLSLFPQPYSLSQSNVPFLFFPNVQHPPPPSLLVEPPDYGLCLFIFS